VSLRDERESPPGRIEHDFTGDIATAPRVINESCTHGICPLPSYPDHRAARKISSTEHRWPCSGHGTNTASECEGHITNGPRLSTRRRTESWIAPRSKGFSVFIPPSLLFVRLISMAEKGISPINVDGAYGVRGCFIGLIPFSFPRDDRIGHEP